MKRRLIVGAAAVVLAGSVFNGAAWAASPEWVRGEIIKMAPQKLQVTLRHEAIKSMGMDAMTMPYLIGNASVLQGFKVGDAVRFTVVMQGDQMRIERMEHVR